MEVSFIHAQISFHLHVNKTNFHMKGFAPGPALKQRRKATRKSPIRTTNNLQLKCYKFVRMFCKKTWKIDYKGNSGN